MEISESPKPLSDSRLRSYRRMADESDARQERDAESRRLAALRRDMGWGADA